MAKHLQYAMDRLKRQLLALSADVEESLHLAVKALQTRDDKLALQVIEKDSKIDDMEVEVEEECLKILALHQPVAIDLRFITAVHKIDTDLERIGDLAVNIAERTLYLVQSPAIDLPIDFTEMTEKAQEMLRSAITALVNMDADLARKVWNADDGVDEINRDMHTTIKAAMHERPSELDAFLQLLSCCKHIERVADHATNIAKDVIYMTEGEIVRHRGAEFK